MEICAPLYCIYVEQIILESVTEAKELASSQNKKTHNTVDSGC